MNYFKFFVGVIIISFLIPSYALAAKSDFIPLKAGNWWQYRMTKTAGFNEKGEYVLNKDGSYKIFKSSKSVKVEILKVKEYKNIIVALFNNIPGGYSEGKATLLVINNKDYYWGNEAIFDFVIKNKGKINVNDFYLNNKIDGPEDSNPPKINIHELSLPLTKNKLFGCDEIDKSRHDKNYCSWVRSIKPANKKYFNKKYQYEIAEYTLSGESHYYYVNNVGLTYFSYEHNGITDEEIWNLQKYYFMN